MLAASRNDVTDNNNTTGGVLCITVPSLLLILLWLLSAPLILYIPVLITLFALVWKRALGSADNFDDTVSATIIESVIRAYFWVFGVVHMITRKISPCIATCCGNLVVLLVGYDDDSVLYDKHAYSVVPQAPPIVAEYFRSKNNPSIYITNAKVLSPIYEVPTQNSEWELV